MSCEPRVSCREEQASATRRRSTSSRLQSLRQGRCYARVMVQIENYRRKRPWIKVYALCYRYRTTIDIAWATSALVGFISIIVTLKRAL